MRESPEGPARSENQGMYGSFMRENRESPCSPVSMIGGRAARGRPRPQARDERGWAETPPRSTYEAGEQGRVSGGGVGGGKGAGQGEHGQPSALRTQCRHTRG